MRQCSILRTSLALLTGESGTVCSDTFRPESKDLLAFCHIEKAAGTSLTHILRRAFFLRYAAVRPMHSRTSRYFTLRDLQTAKLINPYLMAFGGHSVVPHTDVIAGKQKISFITQVREPIARATSNFHFRINRMNRDASLEAYLRHPISRNFQVKKIAGREDLDLAKEIIGKHFLLAGAVEDFDMFLTILANKLQLPLWQMTYIKRNVGDRANHASLPNSFFDELRERNRLDSALYDWIRAEKFPEYVAAYPGDIGADLETFLAYQKNPAISVSKNVMDFVYRNGYLKTVSGIIRLKNGLPAKGSYSIE